VGDGDFNPVTKMIEEKMKMATNKRRRRHARELPFLAGQLGSLVGLNS
jgi:hypothetical protein